MMKSNTKEVILTHSSYKCTFLRAVIKNECKFPMEISHNLICGIGASIPQSSVSLNDNGHFICSLAQSILLLKMCYILNVALEQAEYVVHNSKQPTKNIHRTMLIWRT